MNSPNDVLYSLYGKTDPSCDRDESWFGGEWIWDLMEAMQWKLYDRD